jgi:hypothetical protein
MANQEQIAGEFARLKKFEEDRQERMKEYHRSRMERIRRDANAFLGTRLLETDMAYFNLQDLQQEIFSAKMDLILQVLRRKV